MSEKTIGRYQIRRELGRGGMATVYLAYDPVLEREVALKLLPNYFAHDPEFSARFEQEAKTIAGLEHGSIVSMYDYGEEEGPYFVMRLMKGGSLKERIAQGRLNLTEAAHLVNRIAGALDKAHSKGIVHRDLKPANVLFDEDGEAYLSDFGIVKLVEGSESHTRTGSTLGTPAYMSPEQADGKPDIDGRSDVYALGIVLYEMLAGAAPYVHESMPRLLVMHLTSPIPNLLETRPDLPPGVQSVIETAMAKEREERFQTAGELSQALQAVIQGAETAVPPSNPDPPKITPKPETAPAETTPAPIQKQPAEADVSPVVPQPAPAKSGGIPSWVYGVAAVVVVALISLFALSGRGGDETAKQTDAPTTVAQAPPEQVVETESLLTPETAAPTPVGSSGTETNPNFFEDPSGWRVDSLIKTDDFDISNGQATFITRIYGASWITYDGLFGDGRYEVEVMMPDAEPLTTGVGMMIMYDDTHESWVEFLLDSDGRASANLCRTRCDDFDVLFHNEKGSSVNAQVGAVNKLGVEVSGSSMIFFVNDEKIGSAVNQSVTKGSIGLILFTDIDQDLKAVYDNFTFTPAP